MEELISRILTSYFADLFLIRNNSEICNFHLLLLALCLALSPEKEYWNILEKILDLGNRNYWEQGALRPLAKGTIKLTRGPRAKAKKLSGPESKKLRRLRTAYAARNGSGDTLGREC